MTYIEATSPDISKSRLFDETFQRITFLFSF